MPSVTYYNDPRIIGHCHYSTIASGLWETPVLQEGYERYLRHVSSRRVRRRTTINLESRDQVSARWSRFDLTARASVVSDTLSSSLSSISHHRKRRLRVSLDLENPSGSLAVRVVSRCSITTTSHQSYALFAAYLLRR